MLIYWDTSALVKLYIHEDGSDLAQTFNSQKGIHGICSIGKVEMIAAIDRLLRMNIIDEYQGLSLRNEFAIDWNSYLRFDVNSSLINRACELAWSEHLQGYDAIHLASAMLWRESVNELVKFYTYDKQLWRAGQNLGLSVLPADLL
jgi:uncharacterized protein